MTRASMPVRVVKVGGSLFDLADLPTRLRCWLEQQSTGINVLVPGGGKLAEFIREWDSQFGIDDATAHWLCVDAMSISARLFAVTLGCGEVVSTIIALRQRIGSVNSPLDLVFDTREFMRRIEPELDGARLPQSWQTTSDSIAARLASWLRADELVLLKSRLPDSIVDREAASSTDYVDEFFRYAVADIPRVRCVNLRVDSFPSVALILSAT